MFPTKNWDSLRLIPSDDFVMEICAKIQQQFKIYLFLQLHIVHIVTSLETFENQCRMPMVGWTCEGSPRSPFSSVNGDLELKKGDFVPPQGWEWEGDWFVDPDVEANDNR